MLHVLLDTAIYRHDRQRRRAGFQTFTGLCEDRALCLHVPSIVKREFITYLTSEIELMLAQAVTSVKRLSRAPGPGAAREVTERTLAELRQLTGDYGKYFEESFEEWLKQVHAVVHEIRPECINEVVDRYFSGGPPFKKIKNREDFPDAFIWQIVNDVAARHDQLFAVVEDSNLRGAIASIENVEVFKSLDDFIETEGVQNLIPENFARSHAAEILKIFQSDHDFMTQAFNDAISAEMVDNTKLPYRDDEADIVDISEVVSSEFDFAAAQYYGKNIFRMPFEAELEATLDYFLLKSSFAGLPDGTWEAIEIEDADWNQSYMWVRESRTLKISGELAISVDIQQIIADSPRDGLDEDSVKDYSDVTIDVLDSIEFKPEGPM